MDLSSYDDVFTVHWANIRPIRCPHDGGCGVILIDRFPVELATVSQVAVSVHRMTNNGGYRKSVFPSTPTVSSFGRYWSSWDYLQHITHIYALDVRQDDIQASYGFLVDVFKVLWANKRPTRCSHDGGSIDRSFPVGWVVRCHRLQFPCTGQPTAVEFGRAFPSSTPTGSSSDRYWPTPSAPYNNLYTRRTIYTRKLAGRRTHSHAHDHGPEDTNWGVVGL